MSLRCDARGSATVELVLVTPVLVLLLWFLVYCGRLTGARLQLEGAAHQAARAASTQHTRPAADVEALESATDTLDDAGVTCRSLSVTTDGTLANGSTVMVTVACTVGLHDLALLHLPGTVTLTAGFAAPVDLYRSTTDATPSPIPSGRTGVDR